MSNQSDINNSFEKLIKYCEKEQFAGWDPYDGLNSRLFRFLQLHRSKFFRLAITQFNKKSPINFRPIFLIPKGENPTGIALFLTAYCNLYKIKSDPKTLEIINKLAYRLIELQSKGYSGACWGYNFDWQSRAFFLPKQTPTVVATSFAVYSLLDAYDITKNKDFLETAVSSKNFVVNDLNRTPYKNGFIFSYSPKDKSVVFNASLLGSRLLARIYSYTSETELLSLAKASVAACVEEQNSDGSWRYGGMDIQKWIDSFHTGYNLESLYDYQRYSGDETFKTSIEKGLDFYKNNFFLEDGTPKYYHCKTYPVDPHALAQYIRTMYIAGRLQQEKANIEKSLLWTIKHMQSPQGYFYYHIEKNYTIKIPYIRWIQAWMMYGISHYLLIEKEYGTL